MISKILMPKEKSIMKIISTMLLFELVAEKFLEQAHFSKDATKVTLISRHKTTKRKKKQNKQKLNFKTGSFRQFC